MFAERYRASKLLSGFSLSVDILSMATAGITWEKKIDGGWLTERYCIARSWWYFLREIIAIRKSITVPDFFVHVRKYFHARDINVNENYITCNWIMIYANLVNKFILFVEIRFLLVFAETDIAEIVSPEKFRRIKFY